MHAGSFSGAEPHAIFKNFADCSNGAVAFNPGG